MSMIARSLAAAVFFLLPLPAWASCPGDCDGDLTTTVDELIAAVGIALGAAPLANCAAADTNADGQVTVDELVAAVDIALHGCTLARPFVEFPWQTETPDARSDRLCDEAADPDRAADTTFISCRVEGASFAAGEVAPKDTLTILAYNILRGFQVDAQIAALGNEIPMPDVILLSEADRGCRRTEFRNITREYAAALGFYYVYATEFVELPSQRGFDGPYDPPLCEHGNAIVSRYPLGNVRAIRHAANRSWYTPPEFPDPDEPRLGGRIAVAADMQVGEKLVRLYSLHLESTLSALRLRDAQAVEIASEGANLRGPVIAGGDLNSFFAKLDFQNSSRSDGTTQAFLQRGYIDAHAGLPLETRDTSFDPVPLIIDFVFVRGAEVVGAGICPRELCGHLSDHLPVWADVRLPE